MALGKLNKRYFKHCVHTNTIYNIVLNSILRSGKKKKISRQLVMILQNQRNVYRYRRLKRKKPLIHILMLELRSHLRPFKSINKTMRY